MNTKRAEVTGTIAGILTTGSFIPQAFSVWGNFPKPAADVSLGMFSIMSLGSLLWIMYGLCLRSKPLMFFNSVTFSLSLSILAYKLIYG